MDLKSAIITLSLKTSDSFISAFSGKLCFGTISNNQYPLKQSFIIPIYELYLWYLSIIKILNAITVKTSQKGLIVVLDDNVNYYWEVLESQKICFGIEFNSNITHKNVFTLSEFNNFIFTIKTLSFHTLNLKPFQLDMFLHASKLPLEDILKLNDSEFCAQIIQKHFANSSILKSRQQKCQILLQYYREHVILQNKFETLYNSEQDHSNQVIRLILDSV